MEDFFGNKQVQKEVQMNQERLVAFAFHFILAKVHSGKLGFK
jgi:hypothetical protein